MTSLDHITISELLRLGTLSTKLTRYCDLSTLGTGFHDETENTIACTAHGKVAKELVFERLGLGLSAETTVCDTLGEEINAALLEVKSRCPRYISCI